MSPLEKMYVLLTARPNCNLTLRSDPKMRAIRMRLTGTDSIKNYQNIVVAEATLSAVEVFSSFDNLLIIALNELFEMYDWKVKQLKEKGEPLEQSAT